MKHLLVTTISAVLLVGCGESPLTEPATTEAPDNDIHLAVIVRDIEVVKQHLAAGEDVNGKNENG